MKIDPVLVGKVAAAIRSERLKHTELSDSVLALAAIRAIFDWQPIETARKGEFIFGYSPLSEEIFVMTWDGILGGWRVGGCGSFCFKRPSHWLSMIPLPEEV